jgi:hypothetical protein
MRANVKIAPRLQKTETPLNIEREGPNSRDRRSEGIPKSREVSPALRMPSFHKSRSRKTCHTECTRCKSAIIPLIVVASQVSGVGENDPRRYRRRPAAGSIAARIGQRP